MCSYCQVYKPRMEQEGIKPVSLTLGPIASAYSIYGYRCYHVTFSDGSGFTTSQFMHPDSARTRKHLEEAFGLKAQ